MSNGQYKSIEHRVTINAHKERLSISAFHVPNYGGIISPILGTIEEKMLYKAVGVEEYARLFFTNSYILQLHYIIKRFHSSYQMILATCRHVYKKQTRTAEDKIGSTIVCRNCLPRVACLPGPLASSR